jgi:hypothetical protein
MDIDGETTHVDTNVYHFFTFVFSPMSDTETAMIGRRAASEQRLKVEQKRKLSKKSKNCIF